MQSGRFLWAYLIGLIGIVSFSMWAFHYFSFEQSGLRSCDERIKEALKAPATYKRIDYSDYGSPIRITYEAQNDFGVPIRSHGYCSLDKDSGYASWYQSRM